MAKGSTRVAGVYTSWRKTQRGASLRVFVFKDGQQKAISPKVHPVLKQLSEYLKTSGFNQAEAERDGRFQLLLQRLIQDLKSEYGLKAYGAAERVKLQTKQFDFEESLIEFEKWKLSTAIPKKYRNTMETFWLPFFLEKGCQHPADFKQFKKLAETHVKSAKTKHGKRYSPASYINLTSALNQYLRFLVEHEYIGQGDSFELRATATQEDVKRGRVPKKVRSTETYSLAELIAMKRKIDKAYADNLPLKLRAYAILFGVCSGLRRGNLLGLTAGDLFPDAAVPYFQTSANVIYGWSRGEKGVIEIENATKTFVGSVQLPMIQPSTETLQDVARFLQEHLEPKERLLKCSPRTVADWWREIAKECGFKALHPHAWKHSYATIGAMHLGDWYKGNPYLLQMCCMHSDFRTTLKYVNQAGKEFLAAFSKAP